MIGVFKFLCVFLPAVIGAVSPPGFRVRHASSGGPVTYPDLPQNTTAAASKGWVVSDRPSSPPQYSALTMMCNKDGKTLCVHYDCNGNAAGLQISLDQRYLYDLPYDMPTEGFVNWTTTVNDTLINYWSTAVYFIKDASTVNNQRSLSTFLQEENIYVTGFNGDIYPISRTVDENTDYTKQKCVTGLGTHYFYKMNSETKCSAETLLTWFFLERDTEFIGGGFYVTGNRTLPAGQWNWMEKWNRTDTNEAFVSAPSCFYELGDFPGYIGLKIFFIDDPDVTTC